MINVLREENAMDENGKKKNRTPRQVFTVVDRNGKSFWVRIGAAFGNYDGSETVILDALPISGRIQIRDQVAKPSAVKNRTVTKVAPENQGASGEGEE
jgi:hypothetical protein